jgi:hypothetical protein
MLKTVIASLLGGVLAVLTGLFLFGPARYTGESVAPLVWNPEIIRTELGTSHIAEQEITLTLDEAGSGVLLWPLAAVPANQYPFLHVQFSLPPTGDALGIFWKTPALGQQMAQYWVNSSTARSEWVRMGDKAYWAETLLELALVLRGEPKETVVIQSASLHPASPHAEIQAFFADWFAFRPWSTSSINTFTGVRAIPPRFYPVLVAAVVLSSSLLVYLLYLLIRRRVRRLDWRVPAAIFVICWLGLDLVWQAKLLRQLEVTHLQFAGKNSAEKLLVGPDAALVRFMSNVHQRVSAADSRVFVASANAYSGMRANYYLYPLNVYWQRGGSELPDPEHFNSGDYVVMVKPSDLRFDPDAGVLHSPEGQHITVEPLASDGLFSLFRVL